MNISRRNANQSLTAFALAVAGLLVCSQAPAADTHPYQCLGLSTVAEPFSEPFSECLPNTNRNAHPLTAAHPEPGIRGIAADVVAIGDGPGLAGRTRQ